MDTFFESVLKIILILLTLEGSKNFLALISTTYLQSKVCQEEYNLARAIAEDKSTNCKILRFNYNLKLLSARLEKISDEDCPLWCTSPGNMFDLENDNVEQTLMKRLIQKMDHDQRFCMYSYVFPTHLITFSSYLFYLRRFNLFYRFFKHENNVITLNFTS